MKILGLLLICSFTLVARAHTEPRPIQKPYNINIGPYTWSDPFHWMNTYPGETPSADLLDYIQDENQNTDDWINAHLTFKNKILAEYKKSEPALSFDDTVQDIGNFTFRVKEKTIQLWDRHKNKKTVFFNLKKHFNSNSVQIEDFKVSPNLKWAIIEVYQDKKLALYQYNAKKNTLEPLQVPQSPVDFWVEWLPDSSGFFFVINTSNSFCSELYFKKTNTIEKKLIFSAKSIKDQIELNLSHDQKYLMIALKSYSHRDVFALSIEDPDSFPVSIINSKPLRFTYADHDSNGFLIQSNLEGDFYNLYKMKNIRSLPILILPGSPESDLEQFEVYDDFYLLLRKTSLGLQKLEAYDLNFKLVSQQDFKDEYFTLNILGQSLPATTAKIVKNGVLNPEQLITFNLREGFRLLSRNRETIKLENHYTSKRLSFNSKDGTSVPLTIIYKKNLDLNQSHPVYYSAYGSYGSLYDINYTHGYNAYGAKSLMDRGVIIAIAHVRGGGDKGLAWFLSAREKQRGKALEDFIAGADFLISNHFTEAGKISISSYSAGGFLVGNAISLRPELWSSALIYMGFTDYIGSMLDHRTPYAEKELDLLGDPSDPKDFEWILPISPQDNLTAKNYPPIYIWSAFDDTAVSYHEGVKFAAKLRTVRTNKNPLLLNVISEGVGDHHGSYANYLDDTARSMTFVLESFGIQN